MSPQVDTNQTPVIADVREVGDEFDVSFTDGRHVRVGKAVNGPYSSRFTFGASGAAINVKPFTGR